MPKASLSARRKKGDVDMELKFGSDGLIPAIVQDAQGQVLMLAYMNAESYQRTLETGETWFFSRSRGELWQKGATSGQVQKVLNITADCDGDALLLTVEQQDEGACHEGDASCFHHFLQQRSEVPPGPQILEEVYGVVMGRREAPKEGSYTNYLLDKGVDKILKKVGEETAEVIIAAKNQDPGEIAYEVSDLLYHLLVLLVDQDVKPQQIWKELAARR